MDYKIENDSPVQKTIAITVAPEEVDAAISGAVALYKDSAQIDGFRKGKVPASVIEKKYHDYIYKEAHENLINVHLNDLFQKLDVTPASGITLKDADKALERGKEYTYTAEFEIFPKFDLPPYEGIAVEQEKTIISDDEIKAAFAKVCNDQATLKVVDGNGPAKDGQIANIDFQAFEDGKPLDDLKATNFDLEIGKNQSLPEFEAIVKGIPVGHTGEGEVHFPDDFIADHLAGKNINMRVTVHSVKEKDIPELDDALAKKIGFENAEKLKEIIVRSYTKTAEDLDKSKAEKQLLDHLLKQTDFPLPPAMVDMESKFLLANQEERLERYGKSLKSLGKTPEELMADIKPEAEDFVRTKILLMAIAKKENLDITQDEVQAEVFRNCIMNGDDYQSTLASLEKNGMIFKIREQMICDKAMDLVYTKANVTMVEPKIAEKQNSKDGASEENGNNGKDAGTDNSASE